MGQHESEQTLDLRQLVVMLRRRAPVIALCVVLVTGGVYVLSKYGTKKYKATASLVFNNDQLSSQVAGLAASGVDPTSQQSANMQLVKLGPAATETAAKIGGGLTASKVKNSLTVSGPTDTTVVNVTATWTSPKMAARIANTYANQFISDQRSASQQYYSSAQTLLETQLAALSPEQRVGPRGVALQDRIESLTILSQLQGTNLQLAQAATTPSSPSSPNVTANTGLGFVLGLVLGIGLAFLFERLDRRIREPYDLERIYSVPLLGVIPESKALSRYLESPDGSREPLPSAEAEVFRLLRAHMRYFNIDRDLRTLLVLSAGAGDGKTTIANALAEATATLGSRVLLIGADLRRPTAAGRITDPDAPGLADVLIGAVTFDEAVRPVEFGPEADGHLRPGRTVDVLNAGPVAPPNPAELTESQAMRNLLSEVRGRYDLVIVDTPPLSLVSDVFPLLSQADGAIIVGRIGRNSKDVAKRLNEILRGVDAPLLGVVANAFKPGRGAGYPYAYGYGYYYYYRTDRHGEVSVNGAGTTTNQPVPEPPERGRR